MTDTTERLRELAARLRARTVKKYTMILDDGEIERHSGTITQLLHPDAIEAADTIDHLTAALAEANARADRMREAATELRDDLLFRAEWDGDDRIVSVGAGVWVRFNDALATLPDPDKLETKP